MNSRNKTFKSVVAMVSLTAIVGMSPLNVLATIEDETNINQKLTVGCSESLLNKNDDDQLSVVCKEIVTKWEDIEADFFSEFFSEDYKAYSVAKEKFDIAVTELEKSQIDIPALQDHINKIKQLVKVNSNLYRKSEMYAKAMDSLKDFLPKYKEYYKNMDEQNKLSRLSKNEVVFNRYFCVALIKSIEFQVDSIQKAVEELKICELQRDKIAAVEKDLKQIKALFQSKEYCDLIQTLKKEFNNREFDKLKDLSDADFKVELKMIELISKWEELSQSVKQDIANCKLPEYLEKCGKVTNNPTLNKYQEELELITSASDINNIILHILADYRGSIKENELNITKEIEKLINKIEELAKHNSCSDIGDQVDK